MKKENYSGWLRKELPTNWTLDDSDFEYRKFSSTRRIEVDHGMVNDDGGSTKAYAELKASQPLDPNIHLQPIYIDSHIVVVNKESGALSVPGPRRNPSVGGLVHEYIGNDEDDVDSMIVHRLDMDTSGIICFARNKHVLGVLHEAFRNKSKNGIGSGEESVYKKYEALVCGHMLTVEGEIDLPLVRDQNRPPFMKVHIELPYDHTQEDIDDLLSIQKHMGYIKMMSKAPKESLSLYRVLAWECLHDLPVTRLELIPITGRTHQLRVHCAAIGHPIVGDSIYGYNGDGSPNGGLPDNIASMFQSRASDSIQQEIYKLVQKKQLQHDVGEYNGNMCLHAKQLCLLHPITQAPMSFENDAPF
jgi:23S rRNA-/tRNA-specific pseudouridylate synthase